MNPNGHKIQHEQPGRSIPSLAVQLEIIVERIAVIKLNRMGTEGLASESYSGVSASYVDGYPADILAVLNRKRRIKVV